MKQQFIDIQELKISPLNVRKHGERSGEDLIPSIRANGVIQPLLVRKNCKGFEVLAGQRRYNAALSLAKEQEIDPIPCLVMEEGDDATAIEASLAENIARLPMDELDQYEAFRVLSKAGRSVEEIAFSFGVSDRMVKQRLALAELYPPILNAYRREEVDAGDLRSLTMATKKQQKAWWKLHSSEDDHAPTGYRLKSWLFGGDEIPVSNALFDLEGYKGAIVSDLFGEDQYFADCALFWEHQSKAIAALMQDYQYEGWSAVVLHDVGERWYKWECVKLSKEEGGEVHINCSANGEVSIHEGYLDEKTYRKRQKAIEAGTDGEKQTNTRPELTKPMQNYLALHRHSAVRSELLKHQNVALRFMVAGAIAGAKADAQKAARDDIAESLQTNKAEQPFQEERQIIRDLLDLEGDNHPTLLPRKDDWDRHMDVYTVFAKLLKLEDGDVLRILTFVAAEWLMVETPLVEVLGVMFKIDMQDHWQPDDAFFDLFKDKEAINAMLSEVGGEDVAKGNLTATAKTQKQIVRNFLEGKEREQVEGWQPLYMAFPMQGYTERGGIEAIDKWDTLKALFDTA